VLYWMACHMAFESRPLWTFGKCRSAPSLWGLVSAVLAGCSLGVDWSMLTGALFICRVLLSN
jgi:hypothetical protein